MIEWNRGTSCSLDNVEPIEKFIMAQDDLEYIDLKFERRMNSIPEQSILDKLVDALRATVKVNALYLSFEK